MTGEEQVEASPVFCCLKTPDKTRQLPTLRGSVSIPQKDKECKVSYAQENLSAQGAQAIARSRLP
jgi:hypothetical protein